MGMKTPFELTSLKTLQRYHHTTLNAFGDGETLVEAVQRRPGMYGPNPIAYLSLLARRPTLTPGDLDEALINDRSLVRAAAFRGSVFLMPSEDYPIYFRALHDTLTSSGMSRLRSAGIDERALGVAATKLRAAAFTVQKTDRQIMEILYPARSNAINVDVEKLMLRKLCDIGVLARTTTKGWKGNQYNFALVEGWLGIETLEPDNVEPAKVELVRRYLRAYGPARIEDVSWWTGFTAVETRRLFESMGREIVRMPIDGLGEGLVTLRETADLIKKGGVPSPERVLFLPLWDAYTVGWRDRTRVVDPRFAPWVYDPQGNAASIIVEEGRAVGVWQFRDGDSITLEFHVFEPYNNRLNAVRLAAETHAGELARVAGARDMRVVERVLPPPLADRPAQSFLWPLGKDPVFRSDGELENPMDRRERAPNVMRTKFLDDERLSRPSDEVRKAKESGALPRMPTPPPAIALVELKREANDAMKASAAKVEKVVKVAKVAKVAKTPAPKPVAKQAKKVEKKAAAKPAPKATAKKH
jgi:hypothetical protein